MLESGVSEDGSEYEDSQSESISPSGSRNSIGEEEVPRPGAFRDSFTNSEFQKRRGKPVYIDSYRDLLNTAIKDTAAKIIYAEKVPLPPNYIGSSFWTSEEKELFFNALARYGKDNIRAIAAGICTKTEVEVRAYSLLLQQGVVEKCLNEPRQQMLGIVDLPAALEIGQDCCEVLDQAADGLEVYQQMHEAKVEEEKWDGLWLLNYAIALWVEERIGDGENGWAEVTEVLPEAELLILKNWVELSERIFMNPAPPREHENWRFMAADTDETPSIRYTAFIDFHTLAVSITRRLVQATLFFTMSRLRCMDSKVFSVSSLVRAKDVRVAVKTLGMRLDSDDIWRDAARRCGLHVYKRISESTSKKRGERMSYEEVERVLDRTKKTYQEKTGGESPTAGLIDDGNDDDGEVSTSEDSLDSENDWETADISTHDELESDAQTRRKAKSISELEKEQDFYAELADQRAGSDEEKRLWEVLGQHPPVEADPDEEADLPKKPETHRKRKADLVDWRGHVDYRAEWEAMEVPAPPETFLKNGMKNKIIKRMKRARRVRVSDAEIRGSSDSPESSDPEDIYGDGASPTLST